MKKINVGIFFGGCSPEYSVSLSSASGVILNVDQEKYKKGGMVPLCRAGRQTALRYLAEPIGLHPGRPFA